MSDPVSSAATSSNLTTSEVQELEQMFSNLSKNCNLEDISCVLSTLRKITPKNEINDWSKLDAVILGLIFNNLPAKTVKLVRLVCKDWARVAAPVLAEKTRLSERRGRSLNYGRKAFGLRAGKIGEYLRQAKSETVWDSGFQPLQVFLFPFAFGEDDYVHGAEHVRFLPEFFSLDRFRNVTVLQFSTFPFKMAFDLWLPHWLPTYWRKLKKLKLAYGSRKELQFDLSTEDPPKNDVELEHLALEFDPDAANDVTSWKFFDNCPKLKHLDLRERFRSRVARNVIYSQLPEDLQLDPHHRIILDALKSKKFETLKLTLSTLYKEQLSDSWRLFMEQLVNASAETLKIFHLTLHVRRKREDLNSIISALTIPPSVETIRFALMENLCTTKMKSPLAKYLPALYGQWTANLQRFEFVFDEPARAGKFIVTSPTDVVLHYQLTWDEKYWACNFRNGDDTSVLAPPPAQRTLQALFPEVNYVCSALQRSTDSGISCTTLLFERFGKDGVFDLSQVLAEWGEDFELENKRHQFKYLNNRNYGPNPWNIEILRQVAVDVKRWSDADLQVNHGNLFVFGHLSQSDMSEAWVKVQKSARFCSSTSVQEGFTPEVVKSGQGSYAFHRTFSTLDGETFEEMCGRFEMEVLYV